MQYLLIPLAPVYVVEPCWSWGSEMKSSEAVWWDKAEAEKGNKDWSKGPGRSGVISTEQQTQRHNSKVTDWGFPAEILHWEQGEKKERKHQSQKKH